MIEGTPSRTALRVAMRRAAHQVFDRPLVLEDPVALRILPQEQQDEVKRTPDGLRKPFSAAIRAFMVVRSRHAEDLLGAAVARGLSQYVLLGAGLDTFAYRNPFSGLRVFEVDFPATQVWKRSLLTEAGVPVPENACYAPVDFEEHSLAEGLAEAGFDFTQPVFFAWLGVVPYLTERGFSETLRFIAERPAGSGVVFDYSQPREVLPPVEQMMLDSMSARVAQAGEPFQLFFRKEELSGRLTEAGFREIEDLGGPDLSARYLAGREDGLALRGSGGRIISAWRG
ncbi:class I SAM-dependent methyltransferase [Terriglobus sp. 2YAB30_2]|uniref:class I SAM-dependent methyltransferase n=1 Tax=unclassified Terriglobus TaxID=2628988 RepID=UPI003F9DAFA5